MAGDIVYILAWEGWVCLATVIDCASRKVTGRAMDDNYRTPLITKAIGMAARDLDLPADAVSHSGRAATALRVSSPPSSEGWESASPWAGPGYAP